MALNAISFLVSQAFHDSLFLATVSKVTTGIDHTYTLVIACL